MGSPPGESVGAWDERPHAVTLTRPYYLGRHEVTQAEWQAVMGWNESSFRGDAQPVETITWFDAIDYCNRRSVREGFTPAYQITEAVQASEHLVAATVVWNRQADGYRLPTEAEWEYACRAGITTAFPTGGITAPGYDCQPDSALDRAGWFCANAGGVAREVGRKAPNAWGLWDMHGNVREWCWDSPALYPPGPVQDPLGPADGDHRIARGGSWLDPAWRCRSASRPTADPSWIVPFVGLRLARTAEP